MSTGLSDLDTRKDNDVLYIKALKSYFSEYDKNTSVIQR